ncbi:hypothetical protein MIND_01271900 [Mycena indigotica]|uniref:Uncharacterized protein n=1 Tax=Mycena indigotica TaxID=2126181 RepID=A0A8H6S3C1_9AGAR|nr:uncharacterized protein MIND_01271900 [Mycena indigotica]KAF7291281.1 hypothetical protein MIND_01271900 [Mycena indigotica]
MDFRPDAWNSGLPPIKAAQNDTLSYHLKVYPLPHQYSISSSLSFHNVPPNNRRNSLDALWCMHYQVHTVVMVVDCHSYACEKSRLHRYGCTDSTCTKNFGPNLERDNDRLKEYCRECRAARGQAPSRLAI